MGTIGLARRKGSGVQSIRSGAREVDQIIKWPRTEDPRRRDAQQLRPVTCVPRRRTIERQRRGGTAIFRTPRRNTAVPHRHEKRYARAALSRPSSPLSMAAENERHPLRFASNRSGCSRSGKRYDALASV